MSSKSRYFIRIEGKNEAEFDAYLLEKQIENNMISRDSVNGIPTLMYSLLLEQEEALALKISFPTWGFLHYNVKN